MHRTASFYPVIPSDRQVHRTFIPLSVTTTLTMVSFGDFSSLCANVPLYTCNLFYRQVRILFRWRIKTSVHLASFLCWTKLTSTDPSLLAPPSVAGVGINPVCDIPHLDPSISHFGNIANVVFCGISFFVTLALIAFAWRRKAAVGRCCIPTLI